MPESADHAAEAAQGKAGPSAVKKWTAFHLALLLAPAWRRPLASEVLVGLAARPVKHGGTFPRPRAQAPGKPECREDE